MDEDENFDDIEKAIADNDIAYIQTQSGERLKASKLFDKAIQQGHVKMVEAFLDQGVSPYTAPSFFSIFPIEEAAASGHIDIVKLLIAKGCTINTEPTAAGFATPSSPLARAVYANQTGMVKFLLENGADQNIRLHADTNPPLYDAVQNENEAIVELLLQYKPDFKWQKNKYAISLAAKLGNTAILEKLLKHTRIKLKTVKGFRSGRGLRSPLEEAVMNNQLESVKVLLEYGANPHASVDGAQGSSPIMMAIHLGHIEVLDYMLGHGGKFEYDREKMDIENQVAINVHRGLLIEEAENKYWTNPNPAMPDYVRKLEDKIFGDEEREV